MFRSLVISNLLMILCFSSLVEAANSCSYVFYQFPVRKDSYRAYAIGKRDAEGVRKIHVVDQKVSTLRDVMTLTEFKKIILEREQFNHPNRSQADVERAFDFFKPSIPIATRFEMEGASGRAIRRYINDSLRDGIYQVSRNQFRPPRYEYEPDGSTNMLFMVELKTPDGLIELVFTKNVSFLHMDVQAAGYALHVARKLDLNVESVWAVRIYGGGYR